MATDRADDRTFSRKIREADLISAAQLELLSGDPRRIYEHSNTELYSLSQANLERFQLDSLRSLFASLRGRINPLRSLADRLDMSDISTLQQAACLLLPNSIYKSYPLSFLERGDFRKLTQWLGTLTVHDLTQVDLRGCETIDGWIERLDVSTRLRVMHSSGTSGKLSFIPRDTDEMKVMISVYRRLNEGFGDEWDAQLRGLEDADVVYASYRNGAMGQHRLLDAIRDEILGGDESRIMALYPGRMSADLLSLGGRLKAAEAKGETARLQISPQLLARRDSFLRAQSTNASALNAFFKTTLNKLGDKRITLLASVGQIYDLATAAHAAGLTNLFDSKSFIMIGGGFKGRNIPGDWQDIVAEFLGVPSIRQSYGMTELISGMRGCPKGNYHIPPTCIPYVIDPTGNTAMPRSGTRKGRFGFIDLLARSYWGGFLTGDEVWLSWPDSPCECGREGAYISPDIRRYSAAEGGDDKITCAGAPQAHDNALAYLDAGGN